jgi:hypothetical protein
MIKFNRIALLLAVTLATAAIVGLCAVTVLRL